MPGGYYETGANRAKRVHDLFSSIASRYDLINDLQSFGLHRLWKRRLVQLANPKPGERALDLCCGSGDIAFSLARRGVQVVGLDFAQPMLEVARKRAARYRGELRIQWLLGDVLRIPCVRDSFDIITMGYGLRNLTNWEDGLRELLRVARKGARVLILEFGKPPNPLARQAYFAYLKLAVPCFGRVFCGDPEAYAYILDSLQHYPDQGGVARAFENAGCRSVKVVNILVGMMSIHHCTAP